MEFNNALMGYPLAQSMNNIKTTIRNIKIDYKGVPTYYCDFFLSVIAFREDQLFPTEELLKSL